MVRINSCVELYDYTYFVVSLRVFINFDSSDSISCSSKNALRWIAVALFCKFFIRAAYFIVSVG